MNRERIVLGLPTDTASAGELIHRAERRGFHRFLRDGQPTVTERGSTSTYGRTGDHVLRPPGEPGGSIPIVTVRGPEDIEAATEVGRAHGAVAVVWTAERVIPLENLLAAARGGFQVWVFVEHRRDLAAMLGALEHGADRLVVPVTGPADIDSLEAELDEGPTQPIPWELVVLRRVEPAGLGDRVIVDTTSLLRPTEGLLVGSAAAFLFHVASEALGSRFTRPRPFRVNAGAAHSYTLLADGTTRYLSELAPGDAVAAVEPNGTARSVRVGRIKIERRPLALIEAERGDRRYTVFLQDAETVRLSAETERVATVQLSAGRKVFGAAFPAARHLGTVVDETIEER
ncbi:MAG: 3-dehydroquinate synthase II [Thermoplasmata archaeon]|nr:3-dehydroquinate synthase II [Thermoplasmata archaeon]